MSGLSARMQGIPKEEKRPGHLNLKGSRHSRPEPHLMTPRQEAKAPLSLPDRPPEHAETGNHAQSSSCGSLPHRPRHCGGLESRGGACRQLRRGAQRLRRRLQQPGNHPGRVPGLLQPLLDSNRRDTVIQCRPGDQTVCNNGFQSCNNGCDALASIPTAAALQNQTACQSRCCTQFKNCLNQRACDVGTITCQ